MKILTTLTLTIFIAGCARDEGVIVIRRALPEDAEYQSRSQWYVEPPTGSLSTMDWERWTKEGGHTTIVLDRGNGEVSVRSAACDTKSCNEIRAAAPHIMSALESLEGIRFTIEEVRVVRPDPRLDINTAAFDWSEDRFLPTAEDLDAAFNGGE